MPKNKPSIVDVPKINYIAVRGKGNPNEENGDYQNTLGLLYGVAYTIKMSYKGDHKIDRSFEYVVPPLEGFHCAYAWPSILLEIRTFILTNHAKI